MQKTVSELTKETSEVRSSILSSLAYSAVFSYPLTIDEIIQGLDTVCNEKVLFLNEIESLVSAGIVFKHGDYFSLSEDNSLESYRKERNKRAEKYLPWAKFISRFIGSFPFVRAVFISGSLSKNSMDKDSDIDYFIITEVNRLWLARTLLIIFKKIFLFNSYKLFCINYLIDVNSMEIEDKNVFVANEIATLIPTYSKKDCKAFFDSNTWINDFLPNIKTPSTEKTPAGKIRGFKWLFEKLFDLGIANSLDKKCHELSNRYWKRKFKNLDESAYKNAVVSRDNISSHHPDNFKFIVMNRRREILNELSQQTNLQMN